MRTNIPDLHDLARRDGPILLGWAEMASPAVVAIMARAGYDAILLDMQHGLHDTASVISCIAEAALAAKPVLVRCPVSDYATAARALDLGALGVVAPMISTAEDARRFVAEVKYPPVGARSWGPTRAMQVLGRDAAGDFLRTANETVVALAMIETVQALENLAEILAVDGLDGVLIGPADLSISMTGGTLDPEGAATRQALGEILRQCQQARKIAIVFAADVDRARRRIAEGFRFTTVGYDSALIAGAFRAATDAARAKDG